jgi:hypothetical protein
MFCVGNTIASTGNDVAATTRWGEGEETYIMLVM